MRQRSSTEPISVTFAVCSLLAELSKDSEQPSTVTLACIKNPAVLLQVKAPEKEIVTWSDLRNEARRVRRCVETIIQRSAGSGVMFVHSYLEHEEPPTEE